MITKELCSSFKNTDLENFLSCPLIELTAV